MNRTLQQMAATAKERLLKHASRVGALRSRDLDELGIPRRVLASLVSEGELVRVGRGLYRLSGADLTENHTFAEVAKLVPAGVICLLSALRFHGLTTELPSEVWVALAPKAWKPRAAGPNLRVVRFSGESLTSGIETHEIEGVSVQVYGITKTVADCFKFRNKIGTNVAVEALRDAWRSKKAKPDDFWRFAKLCRVDRVMRPYLESLV